MPRQSDRSQIEELLAKYEPVVRKTFLDAIAEIRDGVVLKVIVERLERGDIDGALAALNLETAAFARLELALAEVYNSGGMAFVQNLPKIMDPEGNRAVFHFAVRNTPGEAELRSHSANFVTRTTDETREAIRSTLTDGLAQGQNPTRTALQVVGRKNKVTGRREGSIIGLSSPQERYVASARAELSSGDPKAISNYLTRERRDRIFDRTVRKALAEEKPIPAAMVDKIAGRYSDRLLKLRGDAIGLNETVNALGKSRNDAIVQQIMAGKVDAQDVTKIWHHSAQEHPRLQHVAMNGKSVAFGDQFALPDGTMMAHPHDPNAPAKHTIFCKCFCEYRIDYIGALVRKRKAG